MYKSKYNFTVFSRKILLSVSILRLNAREKLKDLLQNVNNTKEIPYIQFIYSFIDKKKCLSISLFIEAKYGILKEEYIFRKLLLKDFKYYSYPYSLKM